MFFENAFCTSPICTPSRTSILSGLYPHAHGQVANHQCRPGCDQMLLSEDVKLIADYLKPEGYRCGYAGKWHLGSGYDRRGFSDLKAAHFIFDVDNPSQNEILARAEQLGIQLTNRHQGGIDPDPDRFIKNISYGPSLLGLADHPASLMCDRAVDFINGAKEEETPFMLVWSSHEPHPPFTCPEPFFSMYDPEEMALPESRRDEHTASYLIERRRDHHLPLVSHFSDDELRLMWAGYLGSVSYVDFLVGRLVSALYQNDLFEDTLIIFTSDHGDMMGSHGLNRKGAVMFEELVHVPCIIHPPRGEAKPGSCAELISQVDILPTILDYCGLDTPDGLHGNSIVSLLEGKNGSLRDGVAAEYHSGGWAEDPLVPLRMWRTKTDKYVESQKGDSEYYDLERDPAERHNLIDAPEARDRIERSKSALYRWLAETKDTWPEVVQPPEGFLKERGI